MLYGFAPGGIDVERRHGTQRREPGGNARAHPADSDDADALLVHRGTFLSHASAGAPIPSRVAVAAVSHTARCRPVEAK